MPVVQTAARSLNPGIAAFPFYPLPPIGSGGRIAVSRPVVNMDTTPVSDIFEALPEPVAPLIDALPGPRAGEDGPDTRVDRIEVTEKLFQIEVQVLQQSGLSRSRRAHHVDRVGTCPVEQVPVGPGERVVGV